MALVPLGILGLLVVVIVTFVGGANALLFISAVLGIFLSLFLAVSGTRHLTRQMLYKFRAKSKLGGESLVWHKIVPDSTKNVDSRKTLFTQADATPVAAIIRAIYSRIWPRVDRGLVSFVIHREQDKQIEMFVGMSRSHYNEAFVVTLAASIDAKAIFVESLPEISTKSISMAERGDPLLANVSERVDSLGKTLTAFAHSFAETGEGTNGTVILTMEAVSGSESRRLGTRLSDRAGEILGDMAKYGQFGGQISQILTGTSRASLAAFASEHGASESILSRVGASVSTLGMQLNPILFDNLRMRVMNKIILGIASGLALLNAVLVFTTSAELSKTLGMVSLVVSIIVISTLTVVSDAMFKAPIIHGAKLGIVHLPPYMMASLRFFLSKMLFGNHVHASAESSPNTKSAWPSCMQVFYMHPLSVLEFLSFPTSREAVGASIERRGYNSRGVPDSMTHARLPMWIGRSGTDQYIYYDALENLHKPTYCAGVMGSGKTNFLNVVYLDAARVSITNAGGMQVTPIWAETKGEGAMHVWNQIKHLPDALLIEMFKKETEFRLALEGPRVQDGISPQKVISNTRSLVSSLMAAWGDQIRAESKNVLNFVFGISMLISQEELEYLQIDKLFTNPKRHNIMQMAFYLVLGDLYRADIATRLLSLAATIESRKNATNREIILADLIQRYGKYIDPATKRDFASLLQPPRNKIADLMAMTALWEADDHRQDIYVTQLPTAFVPIVINLGPTESDSDSNLSDINLSDARRMLIVFNWLLWNTIKVQCNDWVNQNKRVCLFFDEVADVVNRGKSDDIPDALEEGLKEGRSKGTSYHIGSQFPGQLSHNVRNYVMSINNKFWFQLTNPDDIDLAVKDLARGDMNNLPFSHENIGNHPRGVAAGRFQLSNDQITPPFTLIVPEANRWGQIILRDDLPDVTTAVHEYILKESGKSTEHLYAGQGVSTAPSRTEQERSFRDDMRDLFGDDEFGSF